MLSRVADNLYWMSRYLERAQHTSRLLDSALTLMLDQSPRLIEPRWQRTMKSLHLPSPEGEFDSYSLAHQLAFDADNEVSIFSCVREARENARQVREEISGEMWECLNRLYLRVRDTRTSLEGIASYEDHTFWRQPHEFFSDVQSKTFQFEGATDATMRHGEGWLFIQVGRGIEQASKTASLLEAYFNEEDMKTVLSTEEGNMKWVALLKSCGAFEPYCRAFSPRLSPERIATFLMLDGEFPRSVRSAVERVETALTGIAEITGKDAPSVFTGTPDGSITRLSRLAGRLKATLDYASTEEIMKSGLPVFLKDVREQCVRIHYALYHVYIGYMAE